MFAAAPWLIPPATPMSGYGRPVIHLRLIVPADLRSRLIGELRDDPMVTNLALFPAAGLDPVGDVLLCDVAREAASPLLDRLEGLGLDRDGGIAVQSLDAAPTRAARRAEHAAPGAPEDGIVWDVVRARADDDSRPSWSYFTFLTLATLIAGVAVITDSPVLVVGAMVVGPEYEMISAIAIGSVLGHRHMAVRSLGLLLAGFVLAITITTLVALLGRSAGWLDAADLLTNRPLTDFIWHPNRWSLVVAVLAGAAGALSVTSNRSNALVGVFISVTTVPAAGNLALAMALGVPQEIGGACAQLGVNVAGMLFASTTVLALQRFLTRRRRKTPPG
jgi:uncharacterized hydrophobic protein (TIGR00271 family)